MIPYSDIPPELLHQKLLEIFLSFGDVERLAVETGQSAIVIMLCQSGMLFTNTIGKLLTEDKKNSQQAIKSLIEILEKIYSEIIE